MTLSDPVFQAGLVSRTVALRGLRFGLREQDVGQGVNRSVHVRDAEIVVQQTAEFAHEVAGKRVVADEELRLGDIGQPDGGVHAAVGVREERIHIPGDQLAVIVTVLEGDEVVISGAIPESALVVVQQHVHAEPCRSRLNLQMVPQDRFPHSFVRVLDADRSVVRRTGKRVRQIDQVVPRGIVFVCDLLVTIQIVGIRHVRTGVRSRRTRSFPVKIGVGAAAAVHTASIAAVAGLALRTIEVRRAHGIAGTAAIREARGRDRPVLRTQEVIVDSLDVDVDVGFESLVRDRVPEESNELVLRRRVTGGLEQVVAQCLSVGLLTHHQQLFDLETHFRLDHVVGETDVVRVRVLAEAGLSAIAFDDVVVDLARTVSLAMHDRAVVLDLVVGGLEVARHLGRDQVVRSEVGRNAGIRELDQIDLGGIRCGTVILVRKERIQATVVAARREREPTATTDHDREIQPLPVGEPRKRDAVHAVSCRTVAVQTIVEHIDTGIGHGRVLILTMADLHEDGR